MYYSYYLTEPHYDVLNTNYSIRSFKSFKIRLKLQRSQVLYSESTYCLMYLF